MKTIIANADADSRKKTKRPGSGRTKGSFSFVTVTLAELQAKFADPTQKIVIGRKWAEQCGFNIAATTSATDILGKIQGETPATQAAVTVRQLTDDE
jgi:hypothetical protein